MEFIKKSKQSIAQVGQVNIPNWLNGTVYTPGMQVIVSLAGWEGTWECLVSHQSPSSGYFNLDVEATSSTTNWALISSPMGDRELIIQASHTLTTVGLAVSATGGVFQKVNTTSQSVATPLGIVAGYTTDTFMLSKSGSKVVLPSPYPISSVLYTQGTVGVIGTTPASIGNYSAPVGYTVTTTLLEVNIGQATIVDNTSFLQWLPATNYLPGDIVNVGQVSAVSLWYSEGCEGTWQCTKQHSSSISMTTDINSGYWTLLASPSSSIREIISGAYTLTLNTTYSLVAGDVYSTIPGVYWMVVSSTTASNTGVFLSQDLIPGLNIAGTTITKQAGSGPTTVVLASSFTPTLAAINGTRITGNATFSAGQAVYLTGENTWALANCATAPTAETVGIVTAAGSNFFIVNKNGLMTSAAWSTTGLYLIALTAPASVTAGTVYSNNGSMFTVTTSTTALSALVVQSNSGSPNTASGTLTYVSGPTSGNLSFTSSFTQTTYLSPGLVYFLGQGGNILPAPPTTVGQINQPLGVAKNNNQFEVNIMRGQTVGGTNVYTTVGLANNATSTIQNVSNFNTNTGGKIEGYITINDGSTKYQNFCFTTQFVVNQDGSVNITDTVYAGTPPTGFLVTNSGSNIQVTLPNISGFVSANATFSINGMPLGATLPLSIDTALISNHGGGSSLYNSSTGLWSFNNTSGTTVASIDNAGAMAFTTGGTAGLGKIKYLTTTGIDINNGQLVVGDTTGTTALVSTTTPKIVVDTIQTKTASGTLTINDQGGTAIASITDAGAWTLGPANTFNTSNPAHTINGHLWGGGSNGTAASDKQFLVGTNAYIAGPGRTGRISNTTSGSCIQFQNTLDNTGGTQFYANKFNDSTTTQATYVGGHDNNGTWTLGNSSSLTHLITSNTHAGDGIVCGFVNSNASGNGIGISTANTLSNGYGIGVYNGVAATLKVYNNGQISVYTPSWGVGGTAVGVSGLFLTTSPSSQRYKTNIHDINPAELDSSLIYNIQTRIFDYIPEKGGARSFGGIAEEVDKILPQLIHREKVDGVMVPESISESKLPWLLLEEMKKLKSQLNAQATTIKALQAKLGL